MSLTHQDVQWHDVYEGFELMETRTHMAIDHAYEAVIKSLKDDLTQGFTKSGIPRLAHPFNPKGDDRAEQLIAAITRYVVACREDDVAPVGASDKPAHQATVLP